MTTEEYVSARCKESRHYLCNVVGCTCKCHVNPEKCAHCGATSGLIEDDWAVWHCLDRNACNLRRLGDYWLAGTPYQVAPLGHVERLEARVKELTEELIQVKAHADFLETIADQAVRTTASIARHSHPSLEAQADRLEADWYAAARPSKFKFAYKDHATQENYYREDRS